MCKALANRNRKRRANKRLNEWRELQDWFAWQNIVFDAQRIAERFILAVFNGAL